MSKYPPEKASAPNSGADDDEEEEEEEEEEVAEWTELMPLVELDAMEDGPSTYVVGGYSTCSYLGEATDLVKYKEDIVVVFPGVYPDARPPSDAAGEALELNEAQLGGLRIYSVRYAREHPEAGRESNVGASSASSSASPKYAASSKRRVGPWFTWLTAAATTTLLTQEGSGEGSDTHSNSNEARTANPLKTAASRAMAATDAQHTHNVVTTTTSGSSVFAPVISATTANANLYPVFDFPLSMVYEDDDGSAAAGGLPHYKQELSEEEADEETENDDEEDGGNHRSNNAGGEGEDEDGAGSASQTGKSAGAAAVRIERAITLAGCCARGGLTLGALTRSTVQHCVVGTPQSSSPSSALRIAVTAAPLTEAIVDHCLVYGGTSYGVYAFPRASLTLQNSLIEGPNAEAEKTCGEAVTGDGSGNAAAAAAAEGLMDVNGTSVLEQLEHRLTRAQRLRAFLQRAEEAEAGDAGNRHSNNNNGDDGDNSGCAYVDVEDGFLPRFVVPQTSPTCAVGIMVDDADLRVKDCLVSHTRLGVLLHGGCAGTRVRGLDIRSCTEAGLYIYGVGGAAEVLNSCVRACGRACLLLVGPSAAEAEQAAAVLETDAAPVDDEEEEEEDAEEGGDRGGVKRRPVLAQHPHLKSNTFIGSVRVQGEVRSGAVVDNFVFLPKEEKSAAAVVTAAATLLSVDASARRGFTYVGVEGDRVIGRTADQVAAV
ncbi:hypothetical protein ABB37_00914 [Leptomonas pyrrhocoris]|uniref:Right handed beta helix domain-containing protein n=1 Tax=Leptomonas pyrrhocoris TaxID=157538 RepID=A0A0N0E0V8_LEPPY|nr:hypothetical protein ABB37_00914 [Leptomonas pyrrhocoris]KPA86868.1 hypothetical protein ABB37_00914 [Leptomonas pyrrhocoris]|eukprot:XP_015665307.1 hypothetical protein ABB37_00914 [Leptomonas pyrrhocoris]